jgi:hypothetical protein
MGWMFYTDRRIQTYSDEKAEIQRLCKTDNDDMSMSAVRCTKVGSTWYAAVNVQRKAGCDISETSYVLDDDNSFTFAAIFLTKYDEGCFGYKDMEESAGPNEARAPLGLLNLLSDLTDTEGYAAKWRAQCRAWADIPTYKEGDHIRLNTPIKLTDGSSVQELQATSYQRRGRTMRCYRQVGTSMLIRLSKRCFVDSTLIKPAGATQSNVLAEFFEKQNALPK